VCFGGGEVGCEEGGVGRFGGGEGGGGGEILEHR